MSASRQPIDIGHGAHRRCARNPAVLGDPCESVPRRETIQPISISRSPATTFTGLSGLRQRKVGPSRPHPKSALEIEIPVVIARRDDVVGGA
jgi:hypothetical protein